MSRRRASGAGRGNALRRADRGQQPPPGLRPDGGPSTDPITVAATDTEEPQALVVTHRIDPVESSEPYLATIQLRGQRTDAGPRPSPSDTFTQSDTVQMTPGAEPVALTSWIYGIKRGAWDVSAELVQPPHRGSRVAVRPRSIPLERAGWSWSRWRLTTAPAAAIETRWALLAPLAPIPAVVPGSFTALSVAGIALSYVVQASILDRLGVSVVGGILAALLGLIGGIAGAKAWHMILQAKPWRESIRQGWSVDGFLVVAPLVALASLLVLDVPVGAFLDSVTPGMYVAVTIGRLGCFFTGCCAGRPSSARWAVRSSDRRVLARRIPTQLIESATGLVIAIASWLLIGNGVLGVQGLTFVVALAAYMAVRQGLLRLRVESRAFSWRRSIAADSR